MRSIVLIAALGLATACGSSDDSDDSSTTTADVKYSQVDPFLQSNCMTGCHVAGGSAAGTWVLTTTASTNHAAVTASSTRVNTSSPDASTLLTKPTLTVSHTGGKKFSKDDSTYNNIKAWITNGAKND